MSSARSLFHPAEVYGLGALQRSRRMALGVMFLIVGLAAGLVVRAQLQPADSVRIALPLHMDMRTLPPARQPSSPSPLLAPAMGKEEALMPLLAEQSVHSVVLPPVQPPQLPIQPPVQLEALPKASVKALPKEETVRKEKARPREKSQPQVRKPRPAPVASPAPPAMASMASTEATAAAAKADTPVSPTVGAGGSAATAEGAAGQAAQRDMATALAVLMQAVERHKSYPRQARRTGAQGVVQLMVQVGSDGKVRAWEVRQGSGHTVLDSATKQLGEKLAGLDTGVKGRELRVVVPVKYSLS